MKVAGIQEFLGFVTRYRLGDVASILGLLITFGGFAIAFWQIRKTKTASQAAQRAAESVREQILQMNAIQGVG
jgi:hypothetical protein